MGKIHYFDLSGDLKVPSWDENKKKGYSIAACGYQRKETTLDKSKVTCKHCLRVLKSGAVR